MDRVDLEALDALHAAAHSGQWKAGMTKNGRRQVYKTAPYSGQVCAVWGNYPDHGAYTADYIAALHNAYPALATELRALRGKVKVLEAEAKQHDYDLSQAINERDEMEERVNSIAAALLLPEAEQEWTSLNDVGERCVEAVEALQGRAYKLYKGLREVVCAVGGVAEDGVSDEFLLNGAGEVRALREERDTLRAEAARLREALEESHRHLQSLGWTVNRAQSALASTTAEWLAARDEQMKRLGAAEELERLRQWCRSGDVNPDDARDEIARACNNRAARLRAGKGERNGRD